MTTVASLDYSIDSNADWQSVLPVDKIADSPEETYDFTDVSARFVRYVGHGSTAGTFNSVLEVSVFALP